MKPNREEYLTTIFKLNTRKGRTTNKDISQWMRIAPSSVTEMTRKLETEGLVQISHNQITLTENGIALAEKVLSKHRLWELFLQQVLHYDWHDVHQQATLLQYATSDQLMERLNAFLNYPPHCPHGGDILLNDRGETQELHRLSEAPCSLPLCIRRIADNKELLDYADRHHLFIGQHVRLDFVEEFDRSVQITVEGQSQTLSAKACDQIFVSVEK